VTYTIKGWYEGEKYVAQVRCLTKDIVDFPEFVQTYRRILVEFIDNEFGVEQETTGFLRTDLADDETLPEPERLYSLLRLETA
jgi:hypothetical protein